MNNLQELIKNVLKVEEVASYKCCACKIFSFQNILLENSDLFIKYLVGVHSHLTALPLFIITAEKPLFNKDGTPNFHGALNVCGYDGRHKFRVEWLEPTLNLEKLVEKAGNMVKKL